MQPNDLLRSARERTASRSLPGEPMSRRELAEAANAWLWETTGERYELDSHTIARYERGAIRWPNAHYRAALRHVLRAANDAALGFAASGVVLARSDRPQGRPSQVDIEGVLMDAAEGSSALLAKAEAMNVGDLTVEQMQADVRRIAAAYLKEPTLPLFARTRALRDRAFTLLEGHQRPAHTRELWTAAGWSLTLLAWMTVDLGRPDVAETHARTAWACAMNADHDGLRAWVRATQHTAAFWQDDFENAAKHAADGLRYATGTASTFLASAYALDLARIGRDEHAHEALQRAQRTADTARPVSDEIGGPLTCTTARAEGVWADALLTLGDPAATAVVADQAIARFERTPDERRNHGSERMARLQLVKARLAMGELDGAAEALAPVLTTVPEHRARPMMNRLAQVNAAAAEYSDEPKARQLRDGIAALTA